MQALIRAAVVGGLILAGATGAANAVQAQTPAPAVSGADSLFRATTLNLSAFGEVRRAPDMATITLGVQTEATTAAEAMAANAARMARVIATLKRGGVASRDLQTSGLSLSPQYVYQENLPPRLTGYQASNQVTVTVRDLSRLGEVLDASVQSGASNVGGVSFGLDDAGAAEDQARLKAAKALQARADLYAKAMGYRVIRLISLNEGGGYSPAPPMPMMAFAKAERGDSTPVEAGEMRVRMDLSATFELSR